MSQSGYWPASPWPVECGGNHRPKVTNLPGFNLSPTDHLVATTRHTGRWNVSFVHRDPGELYLYGTTLPHEPTVAGWVERVDPETLEPLASSGDLPAGGHEWPGGIAVHQNGDLYMVSGAYMHRLAPDCSVVAALPLPIDYAHNGLLILDDGSIITKDIRVGDAAKPSTLTVCDPDLAVLATVEVREPSLGRLAAIDDYIYVPGSTRIFRYRWDGSALLPDEAWQPQYRDAGDGGVAGGLTVVDGRVWLMNNANVFAAGLGYSSELPEVSWDEPVQAVGFNVDDASNKMSIKPTELPAGWAIAPPLVHDGVLVAWDTGGMGMAAFDIGGTGLAPEMLWFQPFRVSMRPLLFARTRELAINDYRILDGDTSSNDLVILDLETGQMKARVPTGDQDLAFMFMTPDEFGSISVCSNNTIARVHAI